MDDMLFLKDKQEQLRNHVREEMITFYSNHPNIFISLISSLVFNTYMPYGSKRIVDDVKDQFFGKWFMRCSDMENISIQDRRVLLKRNVALMTNMFESIVIGNLNYFIHHHQCP